MSKLYNDEWMRINGLLATTGAVVRVGELLAGRHHDPRPAAIVVARTTTDRVGEAIETLQEYGISQMPVSEDADGRRRRRHRRLDQREGPARPGLPRPVDRGADRRRGDGPRRCRSWTHGDARRGVRPAVRRGVGAARRPRRAARRRRHEARPAGVPRAPIAAPRLTASGQRIPAQGPMSVRFTAERLARLRGSGASGSGVRPRMLASQLLRVGSSGSGSASGRGVHAPGARLRGLPARRGASARPACMASQAIARYLPSLRVESVATSCLERPSQSPPPSGNCLIP